MIKRDIEVENYFDQRYGNDNDPLDVWISSKLLGIKYVTQLIFKSTLNAIDELTLHGLLFSGADGFETEDGVAYYLIYDHKYVGFSYMNTAIVDKTVADTIS